MLDSMLELPLIWPLEHLQVMQSEQLLFLMMRLRTLEAIMTQEPEYSQVCLYLIFFRTIAIMQHHHKVLHKVQLNKM